LQITKEIIELKKKVMTDTQSQELAKRQDRKLHILESRVEAATKRFNLMVASNTKLRNQIDIILKERQQFTHQWNKLVGHLKAGKQVFNDLIEQATITFNQREEELQKIQALRERWILFQLSASAIALLVKSRDLYDRVITFRYSMRFMRARYSRDAALFDGIAKAKRSNRRPRVIQAADEIHRCVCSGTATWPRRSLNHKFGEL
jgi:small-conductance mechanosensitive channel